MTLTDPPVTPAEPPVSPAEPDRPALAELDFSPAERDLIHACLQDYVQVLQAQQSLRALPRAVHVAFEALRGSPVREDALAAVIKIVAARMVRPATRVDG